METLKCEECGGTIPFNHRWNGYAGTPAKYCSKACKQKAYRKRKKSVML